TKFSGAPNSANICSAPLSFLVPLKTTKTGKIVKGRRPLRIKGTSSAVVKDSDGLTLECRPSTCGDGIIDKDHETCDDGNRTNNDGCNQACQIEPGYSCFNEPSTCVPFTPTFTVTSTPTVTDTPTVTPTSTETPTHTPTNTPTNTRTPTSTRTSTSTRTPSNTPTQTSTATVTNTPTETA